ncbi:hypothetical protein KSP39_PZI014000 [Platanthera zijinensis]|uniref:Integrase catalytic domain-containing protein n=1 Tax=Platanthera zijinensis TaxID=2320716 RepID=A0AAP0BC02_9ASPA
MDSNETVQNFFAKITSIVNQIRSLGGVIEEQQIVEKVLRSLPHSHKHIVSAILEAHDLETLTVIDLMASLQTHEDLLNIHEEPELEKVFQTQVTVQHKKNTEKRRNDAGKNTTRPKNFGPQRQNNTNNNDGNYPPCIICKKSNHEPKNCYWRCKNCKIPNHSAEKCWYKPKEEAKVTENDSDQYLFTCSSSKSCDDISTWYIDSGCSNHMVCDESFFTTIDKNWKSVVTLGGGRKEKIEGRGTITVLTPQGETKMIANVQYVPTLTQNLLSVGQLLKKGFKVHFNDNTCEIVEPRGLTVVITAHMNTSNIFVLSLPPAQPKALMTDTDSVAQNSQLWHNRLGHISPSTMSYVIKEQLVDGIPDITISLHNCSSCVEAKSHRLPFPKTATRRASTPLELLHMDLWGPAPVPSLGEKKYYLLIVDDYSRYMWLYHLTNKSKTFEKFQNYKKLMENQLDKKIKAVRTDRGGEFTSNQFNKFCMESGIRRELTAPYSPQQNGIVKRRNRTILEVARSMILHSGSPKSFWGEAITTVVYILNRLPSKSLQKTTPYEVLHGQKPSMSHLKTFGCIAFTHINKGGGDKLESKSQKCILLGYSNESKAYRLLEPNTKKITIARDVIFHENEFYNWASDSTPINSTFRVPVELETSSNPIPCNGDSVEQENEPHDSESETSSPIKTRSITDLYQSTEVVMLAHTPTSHNEALQNKDWREAMVEELKTIEKNGTWLLLPRPPGKKLLA